MKPRRTTSFERIFLGMVSTCSGLRDTSSPFSSSAMTGKKLSNSCIFFCLCSTVPPPPEVFGFRLLANCSNTVSVLAGSKSKTYAFSLRLNSGFPAPSVLPVVIRHGFCALNAACIYNDGLDIFDNMSTAVHSGMVTPVVSCLTERVIVLSYFSIASITLSYALSDTSSSPLLPAPTAAMT